MGKPINPDHLQAPSGIECLVCHKVSKGHDLRLKEEKKEEGNKLLFISRTYYCSCGEQIYKITARD